MPSNLLALLQSQQRLSVSAEQLSQQMQERGFASTPDFLLETGIVSNEQLAQIQSVHLQEPIIALCDYPITETNLRLELKELVFRHQSLPVQLHGEVLTVATSDLTNLEAQDDFRFATGFQIRAVLADHRQLTRHIRKLFGEPFGASSHSKNPISNDELTQLLDDDEHHSSEEQVPDEAPVSRYIQQVIFDAIRKQASDIHFEPFEHSYQIRFRLDGILQTHSTPPAGISRRLSTRLKILAKLNIAERRLPQDGRIKLTLSPEKAVDMRVSTLPTLWGEKVVLRILDGANVALDMDTLGLDDKQKQDYLTALDKPQGMILVTGPTGSGKTVSLYTGLAYLNTATRNIATAEDPVEINLPGINQVTIHSDIGLNFAKALRAFLRQDPDVVMVGEMRDLATAEIGIKAAQTGHLVLSTLHTNSAADSITRLSNMGIAPYNLAASLTLVIAQRLVRRLCQHCQLPHHADDSLLSSLAQHYPGIEPHRVRQASQHGCDHCNNGYLGRVGIYEVMPIDSTLAEAIGQGAPASHLERLAVSKGMSTLVQSSIEKLNMGHTSVAELQRVMGL